jgi:hypothetical protein
MSLDQELQMKIASLEAAILESHPTIPILLQQIHRQLKADPACVTLLSEDEIGIIVSGLKRQTQTELVSASMKKPSKSLKSVGILDL